RFSGRGNSVVAALGGRATRRLLVESDLITAVQVVVGVPAVLILYIWLTERLITPFGDVWQKRLRPWLWILPALAFLGFFLVYPTIRTIIRSLYGKSERQQEFVGLDNYRWFFTSNEALGTLFNN